MDKNTLFWVIFIMQVALGQVFLQEESSISSDHPKPEVHRRYEWQCGEEICWLNPDTGETGP